MYEAEYDRKYRFKEIKVIMGGPREVGLLINLVSGILIMGWGWGGGGGGQRGGQRKHVRQYMY